MEDLYPFDNIKPDFINEQGVKYWEIDDLNKKLIKNNIRIKAYNVEFPNKEKKRVLLDDKGVFYETTNFEDIATRVDIEILVYNKK